MKIYRTANTDEEFILNMFKVKEFEKYIFDELGWKGKLSKKECEKILAYMQFLLKCYCKEINRKETEYQKLSNMYEHVTLKIIEYLDLDPELTKKENMFDWTREPLWCELKRLISDKNSKNVKRKYTKKKKNTNEV